MYFGARVRKNILSGKTGSRSCQVFSTRFARLARDMYRSHVDGLSARSIEAGGMGPRHDTRVVATKAARGIMRFRVLSEVCTPQVRARPIRFRGRDSFRWDTSKDA